jgi:hypothetical protein
MQDNSDSREVLFAQDLFAEDVAQTTELEKNGGSVTLVVIPEMR